MIGTTERRKSFPKPSPLAPFVLISVGVCLALLLSEISFRFYKFGLSAQVFSLQSAAKIRHNLIQHAYPGAIDDELGWIPQPGFKGSENTWGTTVTINEDSTRSNGAKSLPPVPPLIVAVGDSFTFGDEVSDQETWPAYLEQLLRVPVLNGGVFNYGVDQITLRARRLVEIYHPNIVIMSLISDDILRCREEIRAGLPKPYFTIENERLTLQPIPAGLATKTRAETVKKREHDSLKQILGYSYVIDRIMTRLNPSYWLVGTPDRKIENDPQRVSCLLIRDLFSWLKAQNIEFYLLPQYRSFQVEDTPSTDESSSKRGGPLEALLSCVALSRSQIIDMWPELQKLKATNLRGFQRLYRAHMTSEGNQFTARWVASAIRLP